MGDISIKGNKLTRMGFKQGGAYGPLRGTSGPKGTAKAFRGKAGFKESQALQKKLTGSARKTGNIKNKEGKVIGSRIAKAGSLKAMGIPRHIRTKSDFRLKNQLKQIQKMPDKKFKYNNPETTKVKSERTGKTRDVQKTDLVKGSKGKKKYKHDWIKGHRAHQRMGLIKD